MNESLRQLSDIYITNFSGEEIEVQRLSHLFKVAQPMEPDLELRDV